MKKLSLLACALGLMLFSCEQPKKKTMEEKHEPAVTVEDKHTFANPQEAVMKHLSLDIEVDFKQKTLSGTAKIDFENHGSERLFLDTRGLTIEKVMVGDRELNYTLHEEIPYLGSALEISIDTFTQSLVVHYHTSPEASALQWLSPSQTTGKKEPFLFTQSQAILARTWVPCQDSPGIRFTYDAKVKVPKGLMALMSAKNPKEISEEGVYEFNMGQPIPAYLLALSVGDLTFKAIGKRTGVYAEPADLEKAVYEFAEMEDMLIAAEKLYGPYQWEQYDVIVLPPSFPFGGMENPRLTFATPTILAGDRSLTSLIAHELAHSWSGNLVTNATWDDFWMNEGFTVYFENRIMEAIYGKDIADMLALISYQDLVHEMEEMNYSDDTKLKLSLSGRDPDEGMTAIAYDKGFYFLKLLEFTAGREKWDAFLNQYFESHAFQTITTEAFLKYLDKNLLQNLPDSTVESLRIEQWVYNSGLPENCPKIHSDKFEQVEKEVAKFNEGTTAGELQTKGWVYQQWVHFLRKMPGELNSEQMAALDKSFQFTKTGNNEVLFEWLMLVVKYEYSPAYPRLKSFLKTVGRRKFIKPIYEAMAKNEKLLPMAQQVYAQARSGYHFVAVSSIDPIVGYNQQ
ncbi:M1 family metallopeptidase [Rapidithrix thailandica]|uniref:Aminopeptidase N n=1 Tax=Rapidithrix thailandica TaxID=413964 RepID=A0AAW9SCW5_9BACT